MNMFDEAINSQLIIKAVYLEKIATLDSQIETLKIMREIETGAAPLHPSTFVENGRIKKHRKNISKSLPLKETFDKMPPEFRTRDFVQACVPDRELRVQKSAAAYLVAMVNKKKLTRVKAGHFRKKSWAKLSTYDPKKDPKFHKKDPKKGYYSKEATEENVREESSIQWPDNF